MNSEQFKRLAERLLKHLDYTELQLTKDMISDDLRKEYMHILQLVSLSWEDNYSTGAASETIYFAEEGGAFDYDPYENGIENYIEDDIFATNDPW